MLAPPNRSNYSSGVSAHQHGRRDPGASYQSQSSSRQQGKQRHAASAGQRADRDAHGSTGAHHLSSPIAPALDIGLAEAEALDKRLALAEAEGIVLALADALDIGLLIMSSSIICWSLIIWSSSICATAAGANTSRSQQGQQGHKNEPFHVSSLPEALRLALEVIR